MSVTTNEEVSGVGGGGDTSETHLGTISAATMLATPGPLTGWTCRVNDLGNTSPWFEFDGTNWVPLGGRQLVFLLDTDTPELTTTGEQLLEGCSCYIPAGVLDYGGATIRVEYSVDKGTTTNANTGTWHLRLGPGSGGVPVVGDVLMYEFSGTSRTYSGGIEMRRGSATTMRLLGTGSKTSSFDRLHSNQNNQRAAAETISSLASTAQYLSFWADMSSTGEPIKANRWAVYVMG